MFHKVGYAISRHRRIVARDMENRIEGNATFVSAICEGHGSDVPWPSFLQMFCQFFLKLIHQPFGFYLAFVKTR
jgi:hypothetical protein